MSAFFAFLALAVIGTMVYNFTKAGSQGGQEVSSVTGFGNTIFNDLVGK